MKVKITKEELYKKLSDIQNIVDKKNITPILTHFLLVAEGKKTYIVATDYIIALQESIDLEVLEDGRVCIPAKTLFEIVREAEEDIVIEKLDPQKVRIKSGRSDFKIVCINEQEFPQWPAIAEPQQIEVSKKMLLEVIEKTIYAAGDNDSRYVFNGVLFHIKTNGEINFVGTDGHRLAIVSKKVRVEIKEDKKLIVSKKALTELRKFLGSEQEEDTLKLTMGLNNVLFEIEDLKFLVKLIEGTYPNYEQVMPSQNTKTLIIDRESLAKGVKRVSIINKERTNPIKMTIDTNNVELTAIDSDLGEARDEIESQYTGEPITIGFSPKYLLEVLGVMKSEKIEIKLNEPLTPTLIMEQGVEDYKCIIMPMRL